MSRGSVTLVLTAPFASARKPYVRTMLCSSIWPAWFAGRLSAVTTIVSPGAAVCGDMARSKLRWAADQATTPSSATRTINTAATAASTRLGSRRGDGGAADSVATGATATVGAAATAAAPTGLVVTTGGAITIVEPPAADGATASAASSASTKAPHDSHRSLGFFASPR